jgi:SPP1 gp7 family putative phage head morphogenesis protein
VFGKYEDATATTLINLFEESYYKALFDQQQFVGFGSSFNRLSAGFIAAATSTAWSGKNYSQAIWEEHRVSLARYLNRIVTTGIIEGKPQQLQSAELQKAMSTTSYNARRLIRTEGSYVANRGSLLGYQAFGTAQYEFLATLDFKTSEKCRNMDGRVFDVADAKPGVNMPPLHPFCRSTTAPHMPDEEFDRGGTRAARDGKGNTYRVPAGMTYRQWYDKHVKPYKEELLAEQKYKHGSADAAQWARYRKTLGGDAPKTLDLFQNLKYTDISGWKDLQRQYRHTNYYSTHLTQAEQAAVSAYISGGSYSLNATLRAGAALDANQRELVASLDAALEKLPVFEGPVIRSMVMDREDLLRFTRETLSGETMTLPAFTSASTLPGYHESPSILMHIRSRTGRDARMVNRQEGEVIFRRGTRLRITDIALRDGVVVVEAEEIE